MSYFFHSPHLCGSRLFYQKMRTIKTKKQNYLKPTVSVCNVMEESYILATSPNVQPGGGKGGAVTVEPLRPDVGDDGDELVG